MKKRIVSLLLVMAMATTALAGCGQNKADNAAKKEETTKKKETVKQVLSVPLGTEPDSLDLAKVSDSYSYNVVAQIVEGLTTMEVGEDGSSKAVPGIAKSWDVSEDQLTYTFHLRDAKWEDGKPVTAQDFEYGIKRILDPKTASPISGNIQFIVNAEEAVSGKVGLDEVGVKALDEKTFEVKLAYPVPYFLGSCAGNAMYPVRKDIVEKYGESYGTDADKMIGNGPFKLVDWTHNSKLSYVKSDSYWDKDAVKLEELNFKIIDDGTALVGEFENGDIDEVYVSSPEWIEKLEKNDAYEKRVVSLPRTQYFFFNQENKLFSNEKVRQAFSVSIDREEIAKDISNGMEEPAYGWLPNSMQLDGKNFRKEAGEPVKEMIKEFSDPKKLLIEGLKELGMDPDPSKVTVQMMSRNTDKTMAEYFQNTFQKKLGVQVKIDPVEWPVFQERNRGLDYEFGYKSYGADFDDPYSMMQLWITGMKTVPTAWSNTTYDKLVNDANMSLDKELRFKNFKEAEEMVLHTATIAPYAYSTSISFRRKNVKGIMEPVFTSVVYKNAYIEE